MRIKLSVIRHVAPFIILPHSPRIVRALLPDSTYMRAAYGSVYNIRITATLGRSLQVIIRVYRYNFGLFLMYSLFHKT